MVLSLVRPHTASIRDRKAKTLRYGLFHAWLDLRECLFFRYVLVADVRTDKLRRLPAAARVFSAVLRNVHRGDLSGNLRLGAFGFSTPLRLPGISAGTVHLGIHGVSAVLDNGKQLERDWIFTGGDK